MWVFLVQPSSMHLSVYIHWCHLADASRCNFIMCDWDGVYIMRSSYDIEMIMNMRGHLGQDGIPPNCLL